MTIMERVKEICILHNVMEPFIPADARGIKIEKEESYSPDKLPVYTTFIFNKCYHFQPNKCRFYLVER